MDLFEAYGATSARIVEGRGFGFVAAEDPHAALAFSVYIHPDFRGRHTLVSEARPRDDRGGGGGGGGRSSGGYGGGGGRSYGGGGGGGGRRGY
jgi:uncharacterized membrane protein YgcG